MHRETELQTPWLRQQLIEVLEQFSRLDWLIDSTGDGGFSQELDRALDFFDDTGVLDEPGDRIGYILRDQHESDAMETLSDCLSRLLATRDPTDCRRVVSAAGAALNVLSSGGHSGALPSSH
jgi:hypothetical protein